MISLIVRSDRSCIVRIEIEVLRVSLLRILCPNVTLYCRVLANAHGCVVPTERKYCECAKGWLRISARPAVVLILSARPHLSFQILPHNRKHQRVERLIVNDQTLAERAFSARAGFLGHALTGQIANGGQDFDPVESQ